MLSRMQAFPSLSEWLMAAFEAAGTSGYAGPPQLPYARVDVLVRGSHSPACQRRYGPPPHPLVPVDQPRFRWAE